MPRIKSWGAGAAAAAFFVVAGTCVAQGQGTPTLPTIAAMKSTSVIEIDGRLDDPIWVGVPVMADFTQVLPREGDAPSQKTEVRVVYDDSNLYVGIRAFDDNPDGILARDMARDATFASDDSITLVIDPFGRGRDGYYFSVNPTGARADGLVSEVSRVNRLWDTLWEARAQIDETGWTVEIAIPFSSVSFDPAQESWRINIERIIRRGQESVRWSGISRSKNVSSLSDLGELRGIAGVQPGLGLEVRPSASVTFRGKAGTTSSKIDPSLDVTYYLTPSLKANLTANTDFAGTELDDQIVNLSRFPVLFPEKRDFFLQDAPLFSFGGGGNAVIPFYSRRIGLGADRLPVSLQAGGRITGRSGPFGVALLAVRQDQQNTVDTKNLFVGRVQYQANEQWAFGTMFSDGDPRSNFDNQVWGADLTNHLSDFLGGNELVSHAYVLRSDSGLFGKVAWAYGGDIDFPNEPVDVHLNFREVGTGFDPALGFVSRKGIRSFDGSARYLLRLNNEYLRTISWSVRPLFITDLNGRVISEDHELTTITFTTPAGDDFAPIHFTRYHDVVDAPFELIKGVIIQPGDYAFTQFRPSLSTSAIRAVAVAANLRYGDYYDGTRTDYVASVTLRPSRYLFASASYELRQLDLGGQVHNVRLLNARATVSLSPDLSWNTIVQYDNVSAAVQMFSRVRWTFRPGSDVYLVVSQNWDYNSGNFVSRDTQLISKIGMTFRY